MSGCWFHLVNLFANIRKNYAITHFLAKKKPFCINPFNYLFPLNPVFCPNNLSYVRSPYISHFASFLEAPYCNIATQRIIRNRSGMLFPERFFLLLMFRNPLRHSVELQTLLARDGTTVHVVFPRTDLQQRSL